eukprot:3580508-Amphidinium_carterae.1
MLRSQPLQNFLAPCSGEDGQCSYGLHCSKCVTGSAVIVGYHSTKRCRWLTLAACFIAQMAHRGEAQALVLGQTETARFPTALQSEALPTGGLFLLFGYKAQKNPEMSAPLPMCLLASMHLSYDRSPCNMNVLGLKLISLGLENVSAAER